MTNSPRSTDRKKSAHTLRQFRQWHRTVSLIAGSLLLIVSLTGLLLGWKKQSGGLILAKTQTGVSDDLKTWLPIDSLQQIAIRTLRDSISADLSPTLDRIDARPQKGVVKFVFADHYWGIQLDGTTGKVLMLERRTADWIENLHDGSLFDKLLGTNSDTIKLLFTSLAGLGLLTLTITGFWLWYGPRRMRQ
ncbi:MAG: PepSY domain-containing protein [Cytophagales bacterium]|nr:MAG: PepSY domain-containing protein [Cytophagales bacterium]